MERFDADVNEQEGYAYTREDRFSSRVANQRLTDAVAKVLDPAVRSVLDVGCGDGTYTQHLQTLFPEATFTGVDAAAMAIARASKRYPNIAFHIGDVLEASAFSQQRVDVAVVRGLLHHTADPARVIRNLSGCARRLIIVEPNGNNPVLKLIEKLSPYHRTHEERSFSPRTLQRWCAEAGYEVTHVGYAGFVPFFCPDAPAKLLHRLQPGLERLPVVRQVFSAVSVIGCQQRA